MPALSPTMEEGKLAKWLVKEGDTVKSGDIIAEIETDKATMEFEAVDEGRIGALLVPEGAEGIKVNAPIATLLEDGEKPDIASAMQSIKLAVHSEAGRVPLVRSAGSRGDSVGSPVSKTDLICRLIAVTASISSSSPASSTTEPTDLPINASLGSPYT